jgi:hypothetical protein
MNEDEERISDAGIVIEKFMETWSEDCYPRIIIPRQFENFGCVTLGGRFCKVLSKSLERGFNVIQLKAVFSIKATNVGRELISIMNSPFFLLREELPDHRFSPENELLLDAFAEFECDLDVLGCEFESPEEAEQVARKFNDLVDGIREKLSSTEFVKARDALRRACQKNMNSMWRYVCAVVNAPGGSNLMSLRLDLSYRKALAGGSVGGEVPYQEVRKHRLAMLKHIKKYLGKAYAGYICKLEYGFTKGFHFHWFILVKRAYVFRDVRIGKALGQHWDLVITAGAGMHLNCNLNKKSYRDACIGEVRIDDPSFWTGLKKLTAYLSKTDFYLKKIMPSGDRCLWRGEMPKERMNKAGRPRQISSAASQ